jgi:hypothetical protein
VGDASRSSSPNWQFTTLSAELLRGIGITTAAAGHAHAEERAKATPNGDVIPARATLPLAPERRKVGYDSRHPGGLSA